MHILLNFIRWKFNFVCSVGRAIHNLNTCITKLYVRFYCIAYNFKCTSSGAHEHVHLPQTTRFRAHKIK